MQNKVGKAIGRFFDTSDDLIPLDDCEPDSLVVFDNCLLDEQSKIKAYFTCGRHKNISCVYLSQSYGRTDMQVIRNNVNLLCSFTQNKHYTKRIYDDFVGSDMSFKEFENMCKKYWSKPHGFISINMNKKSHDGKYMCLFSKVLSVR